MSGEQAWADLRQQARNAWRPDPSARRGGLKKWHRRMVSQLLVGGDESLYRMAHEALTDLGSRVSDALEISRPVKGSAWVRCWPDGPDDADHYQPAGRERLTQDLMNASRRAAGAAARRADAWLRLVDMEAPLPAWDEPGLELAGAIAARDAAAGSDPVLRSWARATWEPSLPSPPLGDHATIVLDEEDAWCSMVAHFHQALKHLMQGVILTKASHIW